MILDTSKIIERVRDSEEIRENICLISSVEYPPVLNSELLKGEVFTLTPEDQVLAVGIQKELRENGSAEPAPDILIAAVAINRNEKLLTSDKDFQKISENTDLEVEITD